MAASAWSGFYKLHRSDRVTRLAEWARLSRDEGAILETASALDHDLAEKFIENAVGGFPLPLGVAVGFVVDGEEVVVPMAVEESSVVAAASNGAKMAAAGGGFVTEAMPPIAIGQVEFRRVRDVAAVRRAVKKTTKSWIAELNGTIPSMVQRGGGVRAIEARTIGKDRLVLHIHVDTRDAMGANLVNSLCESLAALAAQTIGGTVGLRILSNLAVERLVTARCTVPVTALGGKAIVAAMVEANDFALADPFRAATHNKGIMNGIDPVAIATGNDWRAIEAGAHAFAARDGKYRALTVYKKTRAGDLAAELTLPIAVGTVGGVTRLHPVARVALKLLGSPDAQHLARIMAAVGLAQNIAALRALSAEGIQGGHMDLHARNLALQAGFEGKAAEQAAQTMVRERRVTASRARQLFNGRKNGP